MPRAEHDDPRPRRIACVVALLWLVACSEPPEPPAVDRQSDDPIVAAYVRDVAPVLLAKCGDCHHADVAPPWYAAVPVAGEFVQRDIDWGRQRLDLSQPFPFVGERDVGDVAYLIALRTAILDDTMPPAAYLLTHPFATLDADEKALVLGWVDAALAQRADDAPEHGSYEHALALMRDRCARCHRDGVAADMNGDFVDVVDLEYLVDDGEYIDPDDLEASLLWERAASEAEPMPPSPNDRLHPDELASLRAWLENGAEIP